jgi:hypothetical protein
LQKKRNKGNKAKGDAKDPDTAKGGTKFNQGDKSKKHKVTLGELYMVSRVKTFSLVEFSFKGDKEWELYLWLLMSLTLI